MTALAPLLVILGPTASGKSSLGIEIAERLDGEVVVCDSTQVYRHFDIGTAKVPMPEQRGIPHHLIDLIEPQEVFTAGDYQRAAHATLEDLRQRERLPILTAGTGLYLRALLEGLSDAPTRSEELREKLRETASIRTPEHLYRLLARLDGEAAARIAPRDTQKIIRAIEMRLVTGKPIGEIHRAGRNALEGYDVKKIGLLPSREALYTRIDARVHHMISAGWIDEVKKLLAAGVPREAKPFQFIGYSQLREYLEGRLEIEDAIAQIQQATRRFAKRQITWFRKEKEVHWLEGFGDDSQILASAIEWIQSALR
jgi:tRNA dimethylallyltransferase